MRRIIIAVLPLLAACTGSATLNVQLILAFGTQPSGTLEGQVLPTFQVQLKDAAQGFIIDRVGNVQLFIDNHPTGGPVVLGGTTIRALANGIATFDDITLSAAGVGWTFRVSVTGPDATDALSQAFDIRAPFQVVAFSLVPSSSDVPLNTVLQFTFNSNVAVNSVSNASIKITDLTTNIGDPAGGRYLVIGSVVLFEPTIAQLANLSDSGFLPDTIYSVSVQVAIDGVRSIQGDALATSFSDAFATLDPSFLPNSSDLSDPANHAQLPLFFTDAEGIENGLPPCPRAILPLVDRDSPQVILTSPNEGSGNVGTVAGMNMAITYIRLPNLLLQFSEPFAHWRAIAANVVVRNTDTGETFDLQFAINQTRFFSELAISVLDLNSPFAIDTVPAGNYRVEVTNFSDLAGNLLVNSTSCTADGTLNLTFSTP